EAAQVRARAVDVRGAVQLEVASAAKHEPERTAAALLEVLDVAGDEPAAASALERGIRGQLDDVGPACGERARGAAAEHARRVDDVRATRARADQRRPAPLPRP